MLFSIYPIVAVVVLIVLAIVLASLKILREYQRGVVFLFGHF
mgnify:FL=1